MSIITFASLSGLRGAAGAADPGCGVAQRARRG